MWRGSQLTDFELISGLFQIVFPTLCGRDRIESHRNISWPHDLTRKNSGPGLARHVSYSIPLLFTLSILYHSRNEPEKGSLLTVTTNISDSVMKPPKCHTGHLPIIPITKYIFMRGRGYIRVEHLDQMAGHGHYPHSCKMSLSRWLKFTGDIWTDLFQMKTDLDGLKMV